MSLLLPVFCLFIACCSSFVQAGQNTDSLYSLLDGLQFRNNGSGVVTATTQFAYKRQCALYVERLNVSTVDYSWADSIGSPFPYLYQVTGSPPPAKCNATAPAAGLDRPGGDYTNFELNVSNPVATCQAECCQQLSCVAWVLATPQAANYWNCAKGSTCCYLKSTVPATHPNSICTSGVVTQPNIEGKPPPSGIRSAVPLGGLGAGSTELRADGTLAEWTLENQSPGGAGKLQAAALPHAGFAMWTSAAGSTQAHMLQTHPPPHIPGVASLAYQGAYPVSRLDITIPDSPVEATLYGFSELRVHEFNASATPAAVFALNVHNPSDSASVEVAFMANLPFGWQTNTDRPADSDHVTVHQQAANASDCAAQCAASPTCMSWTYQSLCTLATNVPLNRWRQGVDSGIRTSWSVTHGGGAVTASRPSSYAQSGNFTLLAQGPHSTSAAHAADFQTIWDAFAATGSVSSTAAAAADSTSVHGAASARASLGPGESTTLAVVFGWYMPNLDHTGEVLGNFYQHLYKDSDGIAAAVASRLPATVRNISAWHSSLFGASTLPAWLQDGLLNSVSFWRSGLRFADGEWRQWEAYDCNDVDSGKEARRRRANTPIVTQ